MCSRAEEKRQGGQAPPRDAGWLFPKTDPCSAAFNILPAPNQPFLFIPSFARVVGRERKTTLKCCFFRRKALTRVPPGFVCCCCSFLIKAWCRTGLEVGLKVIKTCPKCLWHLLLYGCYVPRVSREILLCFSSRNRRLWERMDHLRVGHKLVGMGRISCFEGGRAHPVGDRQDGFADK